MKLLTCEKCGASDFYEENGYRVCRYCNSKYQITAGDFGVHNSNIALDEDVRMLLQKCRDDPRNARRYADLILDIDPNNREAQKYLK